jgi:hypothetical protein
MINSCAAHLSPASQPVIAAASLPVYQIIPTDRCSPPLDGVFLSWDGVRSELISRKSVETACEKAITEAKARADTAEANDAEAKKLAQNKATDWFGTIGIPVAVTSFIVGFIIRSFIH